MADPASVRVVDEEISLVPYYPNEETALPWYQDPDVCRQVDNIDHVYTSERLNAMYKYLSTHGACYYISYRGVLVGDVSLRNSGELAIVIAGNTRTGTSAAGVSAPCSILPAKRAWSA